MIRILEPDNYSNEAISIYQSLGSVVFGCAKTKDFGTQILVVRLSYYINEDFLLLYPNVRLIASPTTGVNHIDIASLQRRGIRLVTLKNVSESLGQIKSTSEHTLMLAIALNRRIGLMMHDYRTSGLRSVEDRDLYRGNELSTKSLGILGFGRVGSHLFEMAVQIWRSVKVWDNDPNKLINLDSQHIAHGAVDLFSRSDTICICISYSMSNKDFVDKHLLDHLSKTSCIVNTSRGEVIDEQEVINRLQNKTLYGYATDVISNELSNQANPVLDGLAHRLNLLYTPHIGGCTSDAMHRTEVLIASHLVQLN